MTLWIAADAASATGGSTGSDWAATGVSIDTRTIQPGDLFVALTAERDGHDFVAQALAKGAAAALVSRVPDGVDAARCLLVEDVQAALEALGRTGRARSWARVVAVTGSVGKTSTKEMLRVALEGRVHASAASYNNHWGVPLTLARLPADADYAVIEIGMNHPGEIAPLSRMTRPHVALVTTVGAAHLEAFGTVEGIAREKASIVEGLEPGGTAVLNGDLAVTPILVAAAMAQRARVITFGLARGHHRLMDVRVGDGATVGKARAWRVPIHLKVSAEGEHFLLNALGALAAVQALGSDRAFAVNALAAWSPPEGRGGAERIGWEDGSILLVDDAFNANPLSMAASLAALAHREPGLNARRRPGRRVAILGDMLELGTGETALHAALADQIGAVDVVHCVGPRMRALHAVLPEGKAGLWSPQPDGVSQSLARVIQSGDVVLVKGSKGSRVSAVVDAIRAMGHPPPAAGNEDPA